MSTFGDPQSRHRLLSPNHRDTSIAVVSRGSLIYGNSTPVWDELVVGAANSVLWTDGTDVSWSAAPRLANIADTGGTNRITTATSSPQVTLTGAVQVTAELGVNTAPPVAGSGALLVQLTGSYSTAPSNIANIQLSAVTITQTTAYTFNAISGVAVPTLTSNASGATIQGLNFAAAAGFNGVSNTTVTLMAGMNIRTGMLQSSQSTNTITTMTGVRIQTPNYLLTTAGTITTLNGIDIQNQGGNARATTIYGLNVQQQTGGTTSAYGVYVNMPGLVNGIGATTDLVALYLPTASVALSNQTATTTNAMGARLGIITYTSTTNTRTVTNPATLYIEGAPVASTNVTFSNGPYSVWVDGGLARFDGNGTDVFELPADATDPTGGGGAAAGRIPVKIGGATKYLAYY